MHTTEVSEHSHPRANGENMCDKIRAARPDLRESAGTNNNGQALKELQE